MTTMCSFLLSLVIVGGVEVAPNKYMVEYLEDGVVEWVVVPTDIYTPRPPQPPCRPVKSCASRRVGTLTAR